MIKKKILIFSLAYYPFVGGAEVAIKEITDRIGDEFSFDMVTLRFDSRLPRIETIGNVVVYRIGFSKLNSTAEELKKFPLHLNKYLFQFLAAKKALSLHCVNNYTGIWAILAHSAGVPAGIFKTFHQNVFYVLTLQEGDPTEYIERKARFVWPLFKRGFTLADYLVGESSFLEKWGRKMGFKGKSTVVPNGVNVEHFKLQIANFKLKKIRNELGIGEGDKILITTSRLVKKNAVDDVIKALRYLPETVYFLVLGVGPDEQMLKKLAEDEGVSERVHFLGFIESKEIPPYLHASDIFVRPSLSEGMGNSFIEAMAAGIPIIGTAIGGITDFLKDRETGFICRVKDSKSIAEQVLYVLDPKQSDMVDRVTSNARQLVKKQYDWREIAEHMKNIFKQLS